MRIGVIGAGAVGGAIAALLTRLGHEVEVTAHGEHLDAIQEQGILLSGAWGDYRAQVDAAEQLTRGVELVIVATKAQNAGDAIRDNLAALRGVPLVVIQNGLDSISNAKEASPQSDIVGGLATFASSYLSPGRITVTTAGRLYLGVRAHDSDVPARYAARILADALPTSTVPNFAGAQWTKLVINQINALPAITGMSAQEVIAHAGLRRIMTASMRENVRIGLASRIYFESLQGLSHRGLRFFAGLPLWLGQGLPWLMGKRIGETPNPGSTLQSIRRGQATEIDYLNGAVVRAARALGASAPVNSALVDLVHEVEERRSFFTPAEVVARVRH
jgi:2-dehydropantoate 2-reductase